MTTGRSGLESLVPLIGQLRSYQLPQFRRDGLAGLAVAATLIPQAMAYGELAGLSPVAGLYTALGAVLAYALFTSTRVVAVGPSVAIAAITLTVVAERAGGDAKRAVALAACLALLAGVLCLAGAALRLGVIADFLSEPVLLGYLAGSALVVIASQAQKLIGLSIEGETTAAQAWPVLTHLGQAHRVTVLLSVSCMVALVLLKRYLPGLPASLVVVLAAIALSAAVDLPGRGVAVVGAVAGGLPLPSLPAVSGHDVWALLPVAAGVALIASAETAVAVRSFAFRSGQGRVEDERELASLGASGLAAGVLGGFPPAGSASRSASALGAGARTQVFQLVAAGVIAVVLLTGGPLIARVPELVLALLAMRGAVKLIDLGGFVRIWRGWPFEGVIVVVAALGVAALGVLKGLLVAVALAVWDLVRRAARPHDAILAVSSPAEPPHELAERGASPHPHVLIYRVDGPLFFANAGHVRERVLALATEGTPQARHVILDAEAIFYLDATAAATLARLTVDLRHVGCQLIIARARETVADTLRTNPFEQGVTGQLSVFSSVRGAFAAIQHDTSLTTDSN